MVTSLMPIPLQEQFRFLKGPGAFFSFIAVSLGVAGLILLYLRGGFLVGMTIAACVAVCHLLIVLAVVRRSMQANEAFYKPRVKLWGEVFAAASFAFAVAAILSSAMELDRQSESVAEKELRWSPVVLAPATHDNRVRALGVYVSPDRDAPKSFSSVFFPLLALVFAGSAVAHKVAGAWQEFDTARTKEWRKPFEAEFEDLARRKRALEEKLARESLP